MQLAPWEYLFEPFASETFPDLFAPTWISALVLLVLTVVLYNVRVRQLHRHRPYLDLYEWMLWTGVVTFSLLVVYAVFRFDFVIVLLTEVAGLAALLWIRFIRFPPILTAYRQRLAKQRYISRQRYARPEATIRTKSSRRRRRR